jgi:quercetin dioxygenase-like cupin family protein
MAAPEAPTADPQHYTVDAEDDRVRVLRIRYGPKERSVMHSHPAAVAIALTPAHVRFTFPDGTTQELQMEGGQTVLTPAGDHLPENLTDRPFELILVELKGA